MFLMLAEAMRLWTVHTAFPASVFWDLVAFNTTHVPWQGCSLHDLIQPAFSFLVGAALPFGVAARRARGQSLAAMLGHAAWRSLVLVLLGIWLRSIGRPQTYFTFEDTLSQIGLGYLFLFILGLANTRVQWVAFGVICVGYWAAFAMYPLPGPDFDWKAAGVPADWSDHAQGFAAHWNKNTNLAWAFDRWFLNLFPRQKPFTNNGGGYATLSFIPTLATMILGLVAGGWIRAEILGSGKLRRLCIGGVAGICAGLLLHVLGLCPIVKRIWTPSWTIYSTGWTLLQLAFFYGLADVAGYRRWTFPLVVVGVNSLAMYLMGQLLKGYTSGRLKVHLGNAWESLASTPAVDRLVFEWTGMHTGPRLFGGLYGPIFESAAVAFVFWLVCFWMYRQRIFVKI
jgi:predicted acyltransferase